MLSVIHALGVIIPNVAMLNVAMLNDVMLTVVVLSDIEPLFTFDFHLFLVESFLFGNQNCSVGNYK